MYIRLFPEYFLQRDECFGLFILGDRGAIDLPVTIEGEGGIPLHVVHSDPDHLSYLTGLIVLQAWTRGINELGIPPAERTPVLVVTDRPGRFGEAYLQLYLPIEKVGALSRLRRTTLFEKTGRVPEGTIEKAAYWDVYIEPDDNNIRLHNLFPAYQILSTSGYPRILTGRQHLGRGDSAGWPCRPNHA
jgi:hypothetical protein